MDQSVQPVAWAQSAARLINERTKAVSRDEVDLRHATRSRRIVACARDLCDSVLVGNEGLAPEEQQHTIMASALREHTSPIGWSTTADRLR